MQFEFEQVILASASPRRQELIGDVLKNIQFNGPVLIRPSSIDETPKPDEDVIDYVERLSQEKEKLESRRAKRDQPSLVIGSDTIVTLNRELLGKPKSPVEALQILQKLSGQTHQVVTGYSLSLPHKNLKYIGHDITLVTFKTLTDHEIEAYIQTGDPFDKAGAYGIQSGGKAFVEKMVGSLSNVVGLPVEKLTQILQRVPFIKRK